jgi:mannose-6-phosphate isomerase-like protein (cupin superfamily)
MTRTTVDPAVVIAVGEGEELRFADTLGLLKVGGAASDGRFAAAAFPNIPPRTLAAPLHRHHNEDEYTIVVEGTLGLQLGDAIVQAGPGMWVIKPRDQWHTFWNAGNLPCRTIEIVSPAGFERYFRQAATIGTDLGQLVKLNATYSLDMDFESIPALCSRFGLTFPGSNSPAT